MDQVSATQLFVRVVETSSFSKAAAEFGITQPTATKAVAATETRLGVRLLHRSTRGVKPTEIGALYYDKCKQIQRAVDEAEDLATLRQGSVGGKIRISTSVAFGRRVLVPLTLRYMLSHPEVVLDVSFDDRYVNLVEQGVDLAIRMGQMADSSLGARHLGANPWLMVAAPKYLDRHGEPKSAANVVQHACIIYSSVQGDDQWRLSAPSGQAHSVPVKGPLRSNNLSTVLAAAMAGLGLAIMPWYVAREALLNGAVVQVLADHGLPAQDMHAVFPSPTLVPSKVTHLIQFLKQNLAGEWWLRPP
jgi:DNA-binding transcriptional LysR family regulator